MTDISRSNRSLSLDMLQNTWATFIYFLTQWLVTIAATRMRGYEEAGVLTLAISFSNIFGMLSRFGMRGFQVGDVEKKYSDGLYFTSRLITCVVSVVVFFISLYIMGYRKQLVSACIAMMGFKTLESLDDVAMGTMQRYRRYDYIAISYTLKGVFSAAAFVIGLYIGFPLPGCIALMSGVYLMVLILYDAVRLRGTAFFRLTGKNMMVLFCSCIPLVISSILDTVLVFIPRNAVERICGTALLGYYGTISIIVIVSSTLVSAIWGSILPEISHMIHGRKKRELKVLISKIAACVLALSALIMIVGMKACPFFFRLIYGPDILKHMEILPAVLGNAILMTLNSFFLCIFIPLNKQRFMSISNAAAVLCCLLFSQLLTQQYQLIGACLSLTSALLIRFVIQFVGSIVYTKRALDVPNEA